MNQPCKLLDDTFTKLRDEEKTCIDEQDTLLKKIANLSYNIEKTKELEEKFIKIHEKKRELQREMASYVDIKN